MTTTQTPIIEPDATDPVDYTALMRLRGDLKKAVLTMNPDEARFLVDAYYSMQSNRIRAAHQCRQLAKDGAPHAVLEWLRENSDVLESQVRLALLHYAKSKPMGVWAMGVCGIGPVLAAGLLAHIDITKAPTVGHIWAFAGIDPTKKWAKGQKRPWNASLKVLCWKIGESFVKVSGNERDIYGKVYLARKVFEQANNDEGKLAVQAQARAETVEKKTDAWPWYNGCYPAGTTQKLAAIEGMEARTQFLKSIRGEKGSGLAMLPPGHIQARAQRYATKLFLSHWHGAAYESHYGKPPPLPYPIAQMPGIHTHFIPPPAPAPAPESTPRLERAQMDERTVKTERSQYEGEPQNVGA